MDRQLRELRALLARLRKALEDAPASEQAYRKGYIDALRYVLESFDDDE